MCYRWDHVLPTNVEYSQKCVTSFPHVESRSQSPRYRLTIPRPNDWFPSADTMAEVTVLDLSNRSTFMRRIPAAYLFHLHWLTQETSCAKELDAKRRGRTCWLQAVLDSFAEEIQSQQDMSNWRSLVLNPILVRAFYWADDFNEKNIEEQMKKNSQLRGGSLLKHWEGFYLNQDMVAPVHQARWLDTKTIDPASSPTNGNYLSRDAIKFTHREAEVTVMEASIPQVSSPLQDLPSSDHIQTLQSDPDVPHALAKNPEPNLDTVSELHRDSSTAIAENKGERAPGQKTALDTTTNQSHKDMASTVDQEIATPEDVMELFDLVLRPVGTILKCYYSRGESGNLEEIVPGPMKVRFMFSWFW